MNQSERHIDVPEVALPPQPPLEDEGCDHGLRYCACAFNTPPPPSYTVERVIQQHEAHRGVWVVGQVTPDCWELAGIYTTKPAALAACITEDHGTWPALLNTNLGIETTWVAGEFPLRGDAT